MALLLPQLGLTSCCTSVACIMAPRSRQNRSFGCSFPDIKCPAAALRRRRARPLPDCCLLCHCFSPCCSFSTAIRVCLPDYAPFSPLSRTLLSAAAHRSGPSCHAEKVCVRQTNHHITLNVSAHCSRQIAAGRRESSRTSGVPPRATAARCRRGRKARRHAAATPSSSASA